jgi:hypothetical protein
MRQAKLTAQNNKKQKIYCQDNKPEMMANLLFVAFRKRAVRQNSCDCMLDNVSSAAFRVKT